MVQPTSNKIRKCKRFQDNAIRLPMYDLLLGIRTDKEHYLAFTVNKPVLLIGFGIYGTIMPKELEVEYGLHQDDCHPKSDGSLIISDTVKKSFSGEDNVTALYFSEPALLRKYHQYILYLDISGYKSYEGQCGGETVEEDSVRFIFNHDFDEFSLSNPDVGNFPEIYFKPQ